MHQSKLTYNLFYQQLNNTDLSVSNQRNKYKSDIPVLSSLFSCFSFVSGLCEWNTWFVLKKKARKRWKMFIDFVWRLIWAVDTGSSDKIDPGLVALCRETDDWDHTYWFTVFSHL